MPDTTEPSPEPSIWRRFAWFVAIAAVSGLAVAGAATILRWLILH